MRFQIVITDFKRSSNHRTAYLLALIYLLQQSRKTQTTLE